MLTTLWHLTRHQFDTFDDARIGYKTQNHVNSNLGFWFATDPDWGKGAADSWRRLEVDADLGRVREMPIRELAALSSQSDHVGDRERAIAFFQEFRRQLIAEGYNSIAIVEYNGLVGQYVILEAASIKAVRDLTPGAAPGLR